MNKNQSDAHRKEIIQRREKLRAEFGDFYNQVVEILNLYDPISLTRYGAPPDEYAGEAERIICKLKDSSCVEEVREIVYEVFVQSFNYGYAAGDVSVKPKFIDNMAGEKSKYEKIAEDIWNEWQRYKSK